MDMTNEKLLELFEKTALGKPFNLSVNTVDRYLYYINQLINVSKKDLVDITKNDIKSYLLGLDTSDSYYNVNLSAFRTLYKVLGYHPSTEEVFTSDLTFGIISIKSVKTKEQLILPSIKQDILLKFAKNSRDKAILKLYFSVGVRVHELIGLTLTQYNNRSTDNCIELKITKGSHDRDIWLSDDVVEAIDNYLVNRKESECDNLFISNGGKPMGRTSIARTIKTIAKISGAFTDDEISKMANHMCRRSLASTLLNEKDVPIDIVAKVLGHSNLSSVSRYAKTSDDRIKMAMIG